MKERHYNVDAVHPILKRVVKFNLSKQEMFELVEDLVYNGYDLDDILVDVILKEK